MPASLAMSGSFRLTTVRLLALRHVLRQEPIRLNRIWTGVEMASGTI